MQPTCKLIEHTEGYNACLTLCHVSHGRINRRRYRGFGSRKLRGGYKMTKWDGGGAWNKERERNEGRDIAISAYSALNRKGFRDQRTNCTKNRTNISLDSYCMR